MKHKPRPLADAFGRRFGESERLEANHHANTFAAKLGGPPATKMAPASHGAFRGADVNVGFGFFEPYDGIPAIADYTGGNAFDIDAVYREEISLATPIQESIEDSQCMEYPPIPLL